MQPVDTNRSRWIPWLFVIGMTVVVAVNGGMIWAALASFTGNVVPRPFERGLAYNRVLALQEQQDRLGWQAEVAFVPGAARAGRIELRLVDRDGRPLTGMQIEGRLVRPLEPSLDIALRFRSTDGSHHRAEVALPRAGQWELVADAARTDGRLRIRQRIVVP